MESFFVFNPQSLRSYRWPLVNLKDKTSEVEGIHQVIYMPLSTHLVPFRPFVQDNKPTAVVGHKVKGQNREEWVDLTRGSNLSILSKRRDLIVRAAWDFQDNVSGHIIQYGGASILSYSYCIFCNSIKLPSFQRGRDDESALLYIRIYFICRIACFLHGLLS